MTRSNFWEEHGDVPSAEALQRVVASLQGEPSLAATTHAMEALVRWHDAGRPAHDERAVDAITHEVTLRLTRAPLVVLDFVSRTSTIAGGARDDEQFEVSWRRSAIQLLLDQHAAVFEELEPVQRETVVDLIDSIDFELRRMGRDYGRLPDDELPRGLPASHWWWWPEPKPGYQRWPGWDPPP